MKMLFGSGAALRGRWSGGWVAWWLALLLQGCGPGVVGTGSGTGDDKDDIAYTPANVCDAPFREQGLDCTAPGHEPVDGTAPVTWADANKDNAQATVSAGLSGHVLALNVPCASLSFEGRWGVLVDGRTVFVGHYVDLQAPSGLPAVLAAKVDAAEPEAAALIELQDAAGGRIAGPWLVRRVTPPVAFAACPR